MDTALRFDALHQCVQIGRIAPAVGLDLKCTPVARILVLVDSVSHLPQGSPQLLFLLALDSQARERQRDKRQNRQDGGRDDQFQKSKASGLRAWQRRSMDRFVT